MEAVQVQKSMERLADLEKLIAMVSNGQNLPVESSSLFVPYCKEADFFPNEEAVKFFKVSNV